MQNWDDIRIFLAVYRAGSTLGAARTLGIAQTTVARRIDALEHRLGLFLFARDTRGFHPTQAAQALHESAEAVETAAGRVFAQAARLGDAHDQNIRIATSASTYELVISALMAEYSALHPQVRFQTDISDRTVSLARGEADIALRHGTRNDGDDVLCRRLGGHSWVVCCSAAYAEAHGVPQTPAALKDHRVVSFEAQGPAELVREWWADQVAEDNIVMHCPTIETMFSAVKSGIGIGTLPAILTLTVDPPLVQCLTLPPHTEAPIWLMVSPRAASRKTVRQFADFISENYIRVMREAVPAARGGR